MSHLIEKMKNLGAQLQDATVKLCNFEARFEKSEIEELQGLSEELETLENETISIVKQLLACEQALADAA